METFVKQSLLFDFYGELLTEHQRKIYQEVVFEDFSISEIARDEGISRQGIHDLMKRSEKSLEEYESRLHLVEKFLRIRSAAEKIRNLSAASGQPDLKSMRSINRIAAEILEEL